jgi:hypothetical protein
VNTEERQLTDLLHRMTPEPPRRVTVEDIAFRLANEAGQGGRARYRAPRLRKPRRREPRRTRPNRGRAWAPVLAAATVVVVAGGSAALAVGLTSNHGPAATPGSTRTTNSAVPATSSASTSPAVVSTSAVPIQGGPYGAELVNKKNFTPGTLVSGDNYLFGVEPGYLDEIDPANGTVVHQVPDSAQVTSAPVIVGDQVWAVTTYTSAGAILTGYNATTMEHVASVQVPVSGRVSFAAAGVLAAGSHHDLYLAAGNDIAVVSTDTHKVTRRFVELQGPINSLATSPDGTRLYVSLGNFTLLTYYIPGLAQLATSTMSVDGVAANLVVTSGGVWGTETTQSTTVWFAPGGNLAKSVHVGDATGANGYSVPTYSGGTVWIGGSQALVCASPATGKVLATVGIPRDNGGLEYLGGVATSAGRAYASYSSPAAQLTGMAAMTVPSACGG